ncbi:hypothetical protein RG836_15065 [Pseudomonas sp. SZMC_28357]|uniref:hypothetical protein n=1 Tax=Pseudomonas sp. SZMC_28357 TaxID=3074380 RepID=UPI0028713456|nr:hypothetical protein [Pseudomonas sp. SZMC_28357]MDR9752774.1 hypothetical protein [Pseudomonas sp. SZMC_28357]
MKTLQLLATPIIALSLLLPASAFAHESTDPSEKITVLQDQNLVTNRCGNSHK